MGVGGHSGHFDLHSKTDERLLKHVKQEGDIIICIFSKDISVN